ncbi:MAG: ABC transporter ATP-binding protein/permease, partial [Actinobacteria bacterium]|nr:ABC transporter ATP-binding protein/permease [Actinomycetota bacterium]
MNMRKGLASLLAGQRARLVVLAALALVGGLAESVVLVLIVQTAVALSSQDPASLHVGPIHIESVKPSLLILVALVGTLARLAAALGVAWIGARMTAEVQRNSRINMFSAFIDAEWAAQSREREGGLQQLIGVEIDRSSYAVVTVATALAALCSLLMLGAASLVVSPIAAAALVGAVAVLFFGLKPLTARVRQQTSARSLEELSVAQSLNELLRTAEEIRVHGVAEEEKRRLASDTSRIANWMTRIQFSSMSMLNLYQGAALLLVLAALFVVSRIGTSSVANAGAIVLILLRAFAYSQQVQQAYHQVGERLSSIASVEQGLANYRANRTIAGGETLQSVESVEFRNVSYSYRETAPALSRVTFSVERGEIIGVVGPSGSGKSTLVQILLRLRMPDQGSYLVNGRDAAL